MHSRLLAFFTAWVLFLPGFLNVASTSAVGSNPVGVHAFVADAAGVQTPAQDQRSSEAPVTALAELLLDAPELLLGPTADDLAGSPFFRLLRLAGAELVPPYLEGPQRPPRGLLS